MNRWVRFLWLMTMMVMVTGCTKKSIKVVDRDRAKGQILVVDDSGDVGRYVAMDIDGSDKVHMVYFNKKSNLVDESRSLKMFVGE